MDNQENKSPQDLMSLWEQMGASTGSFVGKLIGFYAQTGLDAYQQMVVEPLRQTTAANQPPASETGVPSDIRTHTWSQMFKQYGETVGSSVGMGMDLLISTMKNTTASAIPEFEQPLREPQREEQGSGS